MRLCSIGRLAAVAWSLSSMSGIALAADDAFEQELLSIQREWAAANYSQPGKSERRKAFDALVAHSAAFAARYPNDVEAVAWDGIVLSTYAGEVSALSAMKYAKAARDRLHQAEAMSSAALSGGVYASLGALYSKVPGGFMGFGDDVKAEDYFKKALAIDSSNIDSNYFYGEFLLDQGKLDEALVYLTRAVEAPAVPSRPVFDAGRRAEARALIDVVKRRAS
ncbi:MAG TPA: tetratricopeptide repeat protein [Gammaproteobacteria bacterium]|nr:tetratricopeptide repeat protein [Gammaproteobacteria bacterium]